jgi:MarR family transcriptional regulator for hemolysin
MEKLDSILFYSIDRAIRTYRQYAQYQIKNAGFSITIDQWLIIKCILENPTITQNEIGDKVFKDNASVTRIIELLVKSNYLRRKIDKTDRRRYKLEVTEIGVETIYLVNEIVLKNRSVALNKISNEEMEITKKVLDIIFFNCQKE